MKTLTVAIPTYDRNDTLRKNLALLLPQLTLECRLLILDNHSPIPVADTLRELLAGYPEVDVTIVRHRANIGASANVMRCLELCETEWVWILGDDDPPTPEAVASILNSIARYPQATACNFSTGWHTQTNPFTTMGAPGYIAGIASFSNALFISAYAFNALKLRDCLRKGFDSTGSMAPHVVTLLHALGSDGIVAFETAMLIPRTDEPEATQRWSVIRLILTIGTMHDADVPGVTTRDRELLSDKIYRAFPGWRVIVMVIVAQIRSGMIGRDRAIYFIDQIVARYLWFHRRTLLWKVRACAAQLMVRYPNMTWAGYNLLTRYSKKEVSRRYVAELKDIPLEQRI